MAVTRKRRRWLIATLVVVGILIAWRSIKQWRTNRLFVGRWEGWVDGKQIEVLELNADGTGLSRSPPGDVLGIFSFRWRIAGDQLIEYGSRGEYPLFAIAAYECFTGRRAPDCDAASEVLTASPSKIELRMTFGGPDSKRTLIRIVD